MNSRVTIHFEGVSRNSLLENAKSSWRLLGRLRPHNLYREVDNSFKDMKVHR